LVSGEQSATGLSKRLKLKLTTLSHHLRVLSELKIIEQTRQVPFRGSAISKFYALSETIKQLCSVPLETPAGIAQDERRTLYVCSLQLASALLRQAASQYDRMDAVLFDRLFQQQKLGLVLIGALPRDSFFRLLQDIRASSDRNWRPSPPPWAPNGMDLAIITALPEVIST
jgi:DNA-binding transcriptional ArsR family regulator